MLFLVAYKQKSVRTLIWNHFYIQNPACISKLLHQFVPSQARQIKDENIWNRESYKMTTKSQRPWLGIHKICMKWVLSELSSWIHHSCCFLVWAQQGAAFCQLRESTPTGVCSNGKLCMGHSEYCFTLCSPWKWEWDHGQNGGWGVGWDADEREPVDSEIVNKIGVHLSKWNVSLVLSFGVG